ncbi:hematopoietic progenitor cell antigen CD34-like isoform X1 [Lepisosteus oculatus]
MATLGGRMNESKGKLAAALFLYTLFLLNCALCDGEATVASTTPVASTTQPSGPVSTSNGASESTASALSGIQESTATAGVEKKESTTLYMSSSTEMHVSTTEGSTISKVSEGTTGSPTTETATSSPVTTSLPFSTVMKTMLPVTSSSSMLSKSPLPFHEVECVHKDQIRDRNAVKLKLEQATDCESLKTKIETITNELCSRKCDLQISVDEKNKEALVTSSEYTDPLIVNEKVKEFNSPQIADKVGIVKALPRWRSHSPTVLVSLLLAGLLLAALLIGCYCYRTRQNHSTKGMRLTEEPYQADEDQGNTLVSVAPLNPPEPQEKPSINGESPEGAKNQAPPPGTTAPTATTNGHSASKQAPVADTEL